MEKEQLIELWMPEGFLQSDHQRSTINMETTGSKIFNLLLQNSLLQVAFRSDYATSNYNMHDLVHDLACSILCENDIVTEGVCKSRYIGYKPSGDGLLSIPKGQERYVRTLFFSGRVSDIKFSDFESLHTLTLIDKDIDKFPTSIRDLKHLRYLYISGTTIRTLPDSIGELYHLQTLRSQKEQYIWVRNSLEKLPNSFSCLINLRHLHISYKTTLPPKIGKLTSLQTLPCFRVGSKKGCGISELGHLNDLKGELNIRNLEKVRNKNEAISANLIRKTGINKIELGWWGGSRVRGESNDESVLEGLQPPPNLEILEIWGFKGKSLRLWTSNMGAQLDGHCWGGLNNLMEINLRDCSECEELPMLGHFRNLKYLYLGELTNVMFIRPSFYGIDNCGNNISPYGVSIVVVFPVLERLELCNMTNLKEWDDACDQPSDEVVVFPRLEYLEVSWCEQLMSAPSHFPCLVELKIQGCHQLMRAPSYLPDLQNLEIDKMESGLPLEIICEIKSTSLTHLIISEVEGLECLPGELFSNNHNLSKLEIRNCPKMTHLVPLLQVGMAHSLRDLSISRCRSLRELPDDLHSLNSLETLVIEECPDLKSIPYPSSRGGQQQGFTSLRYLWISDCVRLTSLPIEMVESCAQSLETLTLNRLSSLTNPSEVIGCLHKLTRLTDLSICEVPRFSLSSRSQMLSFVNSLQSLQMGPSSSTGCSWNNVSFNETFDAMLLIQPSQILITLRELSLRGMEQWGYLPDGIQHLTSLEKLCLSHFGIEALPEWFGNLSSLMRLELVSCKKLRYFPSKQAMQRLSKLTILNITRCPLLLKEKRSNNGNNNYNNSERGQIVDSEWPKISHIPTISL